ncbi:MAG: hypothetical protein O2827_02265 [Verrucomicrobia bacterium]|nr:hypothetical protein [Verrucomicrobiota bacterium]
MLDVVPSPAILDFHVAGDQSCEFFGGHGAFFTGGASRTNPQVTFSGSTVSVVK